MDTITQHQPSLEVIDLTSDESIDSVSSSDPREDEDMDTDFVEAGRRFLWYSNHYRELLERFHIESCELQLHALDEGAATYTADSETLVDNFIWKLMDNDLRLTNQ